MSKFKVKDPDSTLDYTIDWTHWLDGDIITGSSWNVPVDLTVETNSFDNASTTVWLSGGVIGNLYECVNTINTQGGRQEDRTLYLRIRDR